MTSSDEPLHDLRLERRALRAERERVGWWRRVVRARLDLAVAGAAAPGPLGEEVTFLLPVDVCVDVPRHAELRAALPGGPPACDVGLLQSLRALDEQLASYEQGVGAALDAATRRLVARLGDDPAAAPQPRRVAADGV